MRVLLQEGITDRLGECGDTPDIILGSSIELGVNKSLKSEF